MDAVIDAPQAPWLKAYPDGVDWHQSFEEKPLFKLLEDSAAKQPDAPYLNFFGRSWTYGEAWALAEKAAAGFQALGVKKGVRVGLFCPIAHNLSFVFTAF